MAEKLLCGGMQKIIEDRKKEQHKKFLIQWHDEQRKSISNEKSKKTLELMAQKENQAAMQLNQFSRAENNAVEQLSQLDQLITQLESQL